MTATTPLITNISLLVDRVDASSLQNHHPVQIPVPHLTTPHLGTYKNTVQHPTAPLPTPLPSVPVPTTTAVAPPTVTSSTSIPPTTSSTIFGQNNFLLLVTNSTKIKYMSMETHLKTKTLVNDTIIELEKLYTSIIMAISFDFETDVSFIPSFQMLNHDTHFEKVFLQNLIGTTHQKCFSIFTRLGSILKACLISSTCISSSQSLKAAIVIRANPLLSG